MADHGTQYTDKRQTQIENRLLRIYRSAKTDIQKSLKEHTDKFSLKDQIKRQQLADGKITQAQYESWVKGQVFTGDRWQERLDSVLSTIHGANQIANDIINGERRAVFGENATYQAYQIESQTQGAISFSLYDSATVTRLIRDHVELMPRREGERAWNKTIISDAIAKGIITGASIDKIAQDIAEKTSTRNNSASVRYARTAMTSAQNAGRIEAMHDAEDMGIKIKKRWLSTLDERTRHAHQQLDGQTKEIDEPFDSELGPIMYPGDASAAPENVWNCRCTLVNVYPKYQFHGTRIDNQTKDTIADLTYGEWQAAKGQGNFTEVNTLKSRLDELQNQVILHDSEHVFSGIWKNDVTYADYFDKQGSIAAKRDYYISEIDKALQTGDMAKYERLSGLLDELNTFENNGFYNATLLQERDEALKEFEKLMGQLLPANKQFDQNAWDDATKAKAHSFYDRDVADGFYRPMIDAQWDKLTDAEKYALWEYTRNSNPINKSLSGYHDDWQRSSYLGPDKTDWGHEDPWRRDLPRDFRQFAVDGHVAYKDVVTNATLALDKTSLTEGVNLVRGSSNEGFAGLIEAGGTTSFNGALQMLGSSANEDKLRAMLIGQPVKNNAFTSTAIASGSGFSGNVMYEIYAPKGTHAAYVEPQSHYGGTTNDTFYQKGQSFGYVGSEAEVLVQRGTEYEITDLRWDAGQNAWHVKMDIVSQPDYFKYGDEDTYNDGATRHQR